MNQSLNHIAQAERIAPLIVKHMKKTLTFDEREELHEWLGGNPLREKLFKEMTDKRRIKKALKLIKSWTTESPVKF